MVPDLREDNAADERLCEDLAAHGYFAEFIEYYSQTGAVEPRQMEPVRKNFPVWMIENGFGLEGLRNNPAVEPNRIALLGFPLGANLALAFAALRPDEVQAVVEYYGWLPRKLQSRAGSMPPVLIVHGKQDEIVPVNFATDLDGLLTKNQRPHEIKIYDDAGHGFNFQSPPTKDTKDAWEHTLTFLHKYLKQ
jgi:carboxymethylenebutenolidase